VTRPRAIPTAKGEQEELPSAVRLWRSLWSQISERDHRLLLIAAGVMIAGSALAAILPLLIGSLVSHAVAHGSISVTGASGQLAVIAGLVIVTQMLQVIRRQLVENVATGFERDSRQRAYRHLLRLDLDHLIDEEVGSIYGRANRSIEGAVRLVKLGAMDLLPAVTLAVSALVVAFSRNPFVALAMAPVVPTGFALVRWQVRNQAGVRLDIRDHKEAIDGKVVELLPAMDVVRSTGADVHFGTRIREACGRLRATELRHHQAMSLFDAAKALNEGVWLLVTLAVAVGMSPGGPAGVGQLTAYVLLYIGVSTPLRDLHRIIDEAAESAQQTRDLLELLDEPEDESYGPEEAAPATGQARSSVALSLSLDSVRFTHRDRTEATLDDVSLELAPGERIGLVGPTACGKSTLLRLVARLHHGYAGTIGLGDRELTEISREELVDLVGYVPQHPKLFKGTVLENITLGRSDATTREVVEAARRANLHEEILRLPAGYESLVAERGETLSGGQRQRLCLARSLLRTPPILLLDEPTSALDEGSQAAVQDAIDSLVDVTLIHVAHRVVALKTMDRILVMEQGRIVEEGDFESLAALGGRFSRTLDPSSDREFAPV
jgi:ATP-binding cassette, subfamily B, bacterial